MIQVMNLIKIKPDICVAMDHDNRHNMEQEKALKNWLRKTSMYGILQWFDAIQRTEVEGKHWKTEMSKRDQLLLEKLGVKPRG